MFQGIVCLILQVTIIGWLPAVIWAMASSNNYYADRRMGRLADAFERGSQPRIS